MKKYLTFSLITMLVLAVSACGVEEIPTSNSSGEQTVYVKLINNSGENIALDSDPIWDDDYDSGSYYLDVEDFQLAPGAESGSEVSAPATWDNYEETGANSFSGKLLGLAAPILEEDLQADYKCSLITTSQWVDVEASYGDTILLKWDGSSFDAEIIKGE
ncbi:MAG: hypothetical protein RBS51_04960 [Anaerovoracaceae bacterium]|jgi:hypothetical protein|nr:hypothetical protein [Anaerovoracaceae bacterium]